MKREINDMLSGVGTTELIVLLIILFLVFGGKKLPEIGRGVGETIREFKKAIKDAEPQ